MLCLELLLAEAVSLHVVYAPVAYLLYPNTFTGMTQYVNPAALKNKLVLLKIPNRTPCHSTEPLQPEAVPVSVFHIS